MKLKIIPIVSILTLIGLGALIGCDSLVFSKEKGVCTKNDAKVAINPHNHKFPGIMDKCASDAWGNAKKTGECLRKHYPNVSEQCTNCFANAADCSASNCKFKCIGNHFSDKCLNCVDKNCKAKLEECTGIKPENMPPKKP